MKPFVIILLCVFATPALSLSCIQPDPVRLYLAAKESAEPFYIARGRLTLNGPAPEIPASPDPFAETPPVHISARFAGHTLSESGFRSPLDRTVTLEITTSGPWPGWVPPVDSEIIAALELRGDDVVLLGDPCLSRVVEASATAERRIMECHNTGRCAVGRE